MIVRVIAPGFVSEPEKLLLTIRLTRLMFPYIFLIGLTATSIGILNSLNYFTSSAWSPTLLNLVLIASLVMFCSRFGIYTLAYGVLLGGILQLGMQLFAMNNRGLNFSYKPDFGHPAIKKMVKLLLPRMWGMCIYQINILIDTILASCIR
jgi:putative peptidoglycan lipid II flippase